jgi:uncharacterized lipoprotein YmbA
MRGAQLIRTIAAITLTTLTAACTSPPIKAYRLTSVAGPVKHVPAETISVRRVSLPAYLDQNNIAKPVGLYEFASFPNDVWAGSLPDTLQTTMVEDLAQRLNGATVIDSDGSIAMPSDLQVEIDVLRFDPSASGKIELTTQVALKAGPDHRLCGVQTINRALPAGTTASDVVATMSALWASAADQIASSVTQASAALSPQ